MMRMRAALALVAGVALAVGSPMSGTAAVAAPAVVRAMDAAGTESERALRTKLDALVKTLPGRYTVRMLELDGSRRDVSIGGGSARYPASTVKLFIAYGVYDRIDAGKLSLKTKLASGPTVGQCLHSMIEPSDNFCAVDLRDRVGTTWLNGLLTAKGYPTTRWSGGTWSTTASDTARLLARLAQGDLLSKDSSARFLRLLETQIWKEAIPPGLPIGVRQASKPGTKWLASGWVQTDAAIVWGPGSRYVLAVFGSGGATIPSITRISRLVYTHLQGPIAKPFVYQRQQMVTTDPLRLRASAPSGRILLTVPKGTSVQVLDSRRLWYLVRVEGRSGWMHSGWLAAR